MKIEKRPSGTYRVRKMYKGQMYTVAFDHKPTQKEAMLTMADELQKVQKKHDSMNFKAAAEEYIGAKRNVLSPTTIRGYYSAMKTISKKFQDINIHDITALDIQAEVNHLAKDHNPKQFVTTMASYRLFQVHFAQTLRFYPPCRKRSKMSRISLLTMILSGYWNVQRIRNIRYPLSLPVTALGVPRYVHSHWMTWMEM